MNKPSTQTKNIDQMPPSTDHKALDERLTKLSHADLQMLHGGERANAAFDNEFDNSFSNIA